MSWRSRLLNLLLYAEIILSLVIWGAVWHNSDNYLRVYFFDVGQGDAILIKTPDKKTIMIDGGPSKKILEKLGSALPIWNRKIDILILTHPDADHISGAYEILQNYSIDTVIDNPLKLTSPAYLEWQNFIKMKNIQRINAADLTKLILAPNLDLSFFTSQNHNSNSNNSSIVTHLNFEDFDSWFFADIEKPVENELLARGLLSAGEVIKVSHHGSKTSSSDLLLSTVSPLLAIISVGNNNRYGHPNPETLERLLKHNIDILRTDENGDIEIISNGKEFSIKTAKTKKI